MRTYDFSPLYRATVGFDRMADLLDRVLTHDNAPSTYPPYNIEKTDENAYRISIAVAGFTDAGLSVEQREAELLLEPGDRHEHRWVRSVQRGAGSLEASLGRDSVEAAQIVELDPIHYP